MSPSVSASFTPSIMQPSTRWPLPSDQATPPPANHYLTRTYSMSDFRDPTPSDWFGTSSTSPSSSTSTLTAGGIETPQASTGETSRTPTPTPRTIESSRATLTRQNLNPTNPWYKPSNNVVQSLPPSPTSRSVSNSPRPTGRSSTPLGTSKDTSPFHPPTRAQSATFPRQNQARDPYFHRLPTSPKRNGMAFPNASVTSQVEPVIQNSEDQLRIPVQLITPSLHLSMPRLFHRICKQNGWTGNSAERITRWAVSQPTTALLLWMCEDLPAWKHAAFFWLQDNKMPFNEDDLRGIAADSAKVLEMQWRVAMRQLPKDGHHVDFQIFEAVPLQDCGQIDETKTGSKTIAKVRYLDKSDDAIFVRKRFEFMNADRPNDKRQCLSHIRDYNELEHENIAKITSSYMQGQVVAFTYPYAQYNLAEYLTMEPNIDHGTVLRWVVELADALAYIHSKGSQHRGIRPQKILVDPTSKKIQFSPFGISLPARSSTYAQLYTAYSNEPSYIYAAPEVIHLRETRNAADVFSLGCCFLDMLTVARGYPLTHFIEYRSKLTHDLSFQANPDSVSAWIEHLKTVKTAIPPTRKAARMLSVIKHMLNVDPTRRPAIQRVVDHLKAPKTKNTVSNQFVTPSEVSPNDSAIWNDLRLLQEYYREPSVYGDD